ncbi:hypothetical protein E4U56_002718 [Claviceps arundinis]|uniref:S-adenosyl-L-methionine-dependent methyltransferase n=1 Tax=Claviceps arundinis TaxID=1623583 RepID=A0A9P7MPS8_9HYPO|nr:hypothetical protein E4U56_002718 [Claviceps arundinis]
MEGNLGRAPVRKPQQVLEVASGTGIWALEYGRFLNLSSLEHWWTWYQSPGSKTKTKINPCPATANPACHVTGTDISAIQHAHSLPNLTFVLHDFEKDAWPAQCGRDYDYIHLRNTLICFDSTPAVLCRAFELLRPGGWIEFYEPNMAFVRMGKVPIEGTAHAKWVSLIVQVALRGGRDWTKTVHYATWLREAGFVNVTEKRFGVPINTWPKDGRLKQIGRLSLRNEIALVDSLGPALRMAVHEEEEARAIEQGAKRDLQDPNMHVLKEM